MGGKRRPRQPWDRLDGETEKAFAAFCQFRDQTKPRSRLRLGEEVGINRGSISLWSTKYEWGDRVDAYDAHLDQLDRDRREKEDLAWKARMREKVRRAEELILDAHLKKIVEGVLDEKIDLASARDMVANVTGVSRDLREESGQNSVRIAIESLPTEEELADAFAKQLAAAKEAGIL